MTDLVLRVIYSGSYHDLDVDQDIPLRVDLSKIEVESPGEIFGIGSQEFVLKGSKNNNRFFEDVYVQGVTNAPGFYNTIPAVLLLNGEVILKGKLTLEEILYDYIGDASYKVNVVDDTVALFKQLEGALIRDADFSPLSHSFTKENILSSWNEGTGSTTLLNGKVFYPLLDLGLDDSELSKSGSLPRITFSNNPSFSGSIDNVNTPIHPIQFQPSIRLKEVVDTIFSQTDYQYTSSFFEDPDILNLYLLSKDNDKLGVSFPEGQNNILEYLSGNTSIPPVVDGTPITIQIPFDDEIKDLGNNFNTTTHRYKAPATGMYSIDIAAWVTNLGVGEFHYYLHLFNVTTGTIINGFTRIADQDSPTNLYLNKSIYTSLNINDEIEVRMKFSNFSGLTSNSGFILSNPISNLQTKFLINTSPISLYNYNIDLSNIFDKQLKSLDVLKGICKEFNLIIDVVDDSTNLLSIEPFDTWLYKGKVVDWNEKIDTAKKVSIKHTIQDQASTLYIGMAEDTDRFSKLTKDNYPNIQYGTLKLLSDSDITLKEKKIEMPFAPIIPAGMVVSGSGNAFLNTQNPLPHLYKYENSVAKTFKFKPRIGYKVTGVIPYGANSGEIHIGVSGSYVTSIFNYSTLLDVNALPDPYGNPPILPSNIKRLQYDNQYQKYTNAIIFNDEDDRTSDVDDTVNLFSIYWQNYIEGLYWDEGRKITANIQFTPEEYKDIKLNNTIIYQNQHYRINKISGFNISSPDSVVVELIKLYPIINPDFRIPIIGDVPYITIFVSNMGNEWSTLNELLDYYCNGNTPQPYDVYSSVTNVNNLVTGDYLFQDIEQTIPIEKGYYLVLQNGVYYSMNILDNGEVGVISPTGCTPPTPIDPNPPGGLCQYYTISIPNISGEFGFVSYIDCSGQSQYINLYWGNSVTFQATEILDYSGNLTGPF